MLSRNPIFDSFRRRGGDDGTLKRQEYNELDDFSNRLNSLIIRIGDRSGPSAPAVESSATFALLLAALISRLFTRY